VCVVVIVGLVLVLADEWLLVGRRAAGSLGSKMM
jgi:hypothetical protein